MEADKEKIKAMVHWPQSKNVIELRGFLGLIRYYRRFVQGYGNLAAPLTQLLHKYAFEWNDETTSAFEGLKGNDDHTCSYFTRLITTICY